VLIIGLVISPVVTIIGLVLNYRQNAKKSQSESEKLQAEADEITLKNQLTQLQYYIKITEDLRGEVAELRKEKNALVAENITLREQVNAQEKEIETLRNKVAVLEGR
jgi:uncharacterized 2Fe-2S/4Fe-4S cluster protein (DUF4445 family)